MHSICSTASFTQIHQTTSSSSATPIRPDVALCTLLIRFHLGFSPYPFNLLSNLSHPNVLGSHLTELHFGLSRFKKNTITTHIECDTSCFELCVPRLCHGEITMRFWRRLRSAERRCRVPRLQISRINGLKWPR